jgi:hypothetical protein
LASRCICLKLSSLASIAATILYAYHCSISSKFGANMPSQTRKPIQVSILGCRKVIREVLPRLGEFVAVEGSGLGSWRNVLWILEGVRGSGH